MKVYMSVDLEGITGVAGSYQILQDPGALPEVRELVTGDINAAIAGIKEAGATEILVNENHSGRDVLVEELDPIAEVIVGKPKPHTTLEGIDIARFRPYTHTGPMKMEIDYANTAFASAACWIPTAVREGPQTVSFTVPDFYVGMKTFFVAAQFPWMMEDQVF